MRSLSASMLLPRHRQRGRPADRRRQLAIDLRTGLRRLAGGERVENLRETLRRQVLVVVVVDLHHRRVDAGTEALDLHPREFAVGSHLVFVADAAAADLLERVRAAQLARRGAAKLNEKLPHWLEMKHRVEGRDLERANVGEAEEVGDVADRRLRQPAARLLLGAPEQCDHRGNLAAGGILRHLALRPREIVRAEGEGVGLDFGEAAHGHQRSTSPNTMSMEPSTAEMSASMWPRQRKSMADRCGKPGARILQRYGLLDPSATR